MIDQVLIPLLKIVIVLNATLVAVTYMVLLERKVIAWAQSRLGPMRVGWWGTLQPIADAIKLMIKEDITPVRADRWVFTAAPIISMVPALIVYAVIPFGPKVHLFGREVALYITDVNVGLLYIVSVASVGVYGIILAGYASNSKYPLLASLRAPRQLVSYEVAVTLALVSLILRAGTLSMKGIVDAQYNAHVWFAFVQPLAFLIFFIGGLAETNRAPFDLPEAEQELTGGFHTEYSGMRFALFFLAEYANMIVVSSVATTLFLGGWLRPFPNAAWGVVFDYVPPLLMVLVGFYSFLRAPKQPVQVQKLFMVAVGGLCLLLAVALALPQFAAAGSFLAGLKPAVHGGFWFLLKVVLYLYVFMFLRFSLPRYRFDQVMKLGWHFLIPVSIVNVMSLALGLALYWQLHWKPWAALLLTTAITLAIALWLIAGETRRSAAEAQRSGAHVG